MEVYFSLNSAYEYIGSQLGVFTPTDFLVNRVPYISEVYLRKDVETRNEEIINKICKRKKEKEINFE